jgi:hypothetical protein
MFKTSAKPAGQPRTLRTIAEGAVDPRNMITPENPQSPSEFVDPAQQVSLKPTVASLPKQPTVFKGLK